MLSFRVNSNVSGKMAVPAHLGSLLFSSQLLSRMGINLDSPPFSLQNDIDIFKVSIGLPADYPIGEGQGQQLLSICAHENSLKGLTDSFQTPQDKN